jgi:hypothetical protein
MKINKSYLEQVIKEEMQNLLGEKMSWLQKKRKKQFILLKRDFKDKISIGDIQKALVAAGEKYQNILDRGGQIKAVDGKYGKSTYRAIRVFQKDYPSDDGKADGLVGGYTAVKLRLKAEPSQFVKKTSTTGMDVTASPKAHKTLKNSNKGGKGPRASTYKALPKDDAKRISDKSEKISLITAADIIKALGGKEKIIPWRLSNNNSPIDIEDIRLAAKRQNRTAEIEGMITKFAKSNSVASASDGGKKAKAKLALDRLKIKHVDARKNFSTKQRKLYQGMRNAIASWYKKHTAEAVFDYILKGRNSKSTFGKQMATSIRYS